MQYKVEQKHFADRAKAAMRGALVWPATAGTFADPNKQMDKALRRAVRNARRAEYRAAKQQPA